MICDARLRKRPKIVPELSYKLKIASGQEESPAARKIKTRPHEPKMNTTPNPLIPQGTFLEHRTKSHFRIAVFTILAVHVVLIGSFLLAGWKSTPDSAGGGLEHTNDVTSYPPPPVTT